MTKKSADIGGFDQLSTDEFINSITTDTGVKKTEKDDVAGSDIKLDNEDTAANEILGKVKAQENKAENKSSKKTQAKDDDVLDDDSEQGDKPADKDKDKKGDKADPKKEEKKSVKGKTAKKEEAAEEAEEAEGEGEEGEGDDKGEEESEEELSFDDPEEKAAPKVEGTDEAETTWMDVAKEVGVEIKEDTIEAFKEAINKKAEVNLAKFKPEAQRAIKFAEAGGSADDFIEPFKKIDDLINESDTELVKRNLTLNKYSPEKIQKAIDKMVENDELEIAAEDVRARLRAHREDVKNKIIEDRIAADAAYQQRLKDSFKEEAKQIKAALESKKDFMGTPLKDENRARIIKKYESGGYEEDLKNPEVIADFLLNKEYGQRAQDNLRAKLRKEAEKEYLKTNHNVPKSTKSGSLSKVAATSKGQDSMDAWDNLENERR